MRIKASTRGDSRVYWRTPAEISVGVRFQRAWRSPSSICMETDFAGDEVDFLIVILLQIDYAVFAEGANRRAGLRIECDEAISGSNVEDSFFAPIAPIRESPARELTGRILTSGAFTFAMGPDQLTGPRVDSNDGASRACR